MAHSPRPLFRSRRVLTLLLTLVFVCSACRSTPTLQSSEAQAAVVSDTAGAASESGSDGADWSNFGLGTTGTNASGTTIEDTAATAESTGPVERGADGFALAAFDPVDQPSDVICSSGYNVLVYNQTTDAIARSNQTALTEAAVSLLQGHVAALGEEGALLAEVVAELNGHALGAGGWGPMRVSDAFADTPAGGTYERHLDQLRSLVENCETFTTDGFADDVFWAVDDLAPVGTLETNSDLGRTTFSHSRLVIAFPAEWSAHSSSRNAAIDMVVAPSLAPYRANVGATYVRVQVLDEIDATDFEAVAARAGNGCDEISRQEGVAVPGRPAYTGTQIEYTCPRDLAVVTQFSATERSGAIITAAHDGTEAGFDEVADIVKSLRLPI